jgi:ubiquinone/menaquinone biosynthesis C-methylase UbiE
LVEFRVGDAYDLPFESDTFDAVITAFVSQFLNMRRACKEFVKVLRPDGYVGINEMYKDGDIPPNEADENQDVEDILITSHNCLLISTLQKIGNFVSRRQSFVISR